MAGLFDPNVDQYVLDKAGEYMVLEVRKHWAASLFPMIREIRNMVALGERPAAAWKPPILSTVAHEGRGIAELADRIVQFRTAQQASGAWTERRLARARLEIEHLVVARLQAELALEGAALDGLAQAVSGGELDPYAAADQLVLAR